MPNWKTTFTHEGAVIGVDGEGAFVVNFGDEDDPSYERSDTLKQAKESIHQRFLAEKKEVNLNLSVLLEDGSTVVVRRLHSGNGNWLTTPSTKSRSDVVYRPSEIVKAYLVERAKLQEALKEIELALRSRRIEMQSVHFYRTDDRSEAIARRIAKLQADYAAQGAENETDSP